MTGVSAEEDGMTRCAQLDEMRAFERRLGEEEPLLGDSRRSRDVQSGDGVSESALTGELERDERGYAAHVEGRRGPWG